jgi:hypothetical protein
MFLAKKVDKTVSSCNYHFERAEKVDVGDFA